jgi:hypothetical protein
VADTSRGRGLAAERLTRTLDGVLASLGDTELDVVLNTVPGRHVADALPEHLRQLTSVRENDAVDPMFVGFAAQDAFAERLGDADWFLYLEDDLVIGDGMWLEKLAFFNGGVPDDLLPLPHRYELWRGRRTYIDLVSKSTPEWHWNRLTEVEVGGWRFAEFDNPHSGAYCLSAAQLERWLDGGRAWYGRTSYFGGRESAATGCLGECFRLYKPHPENVRFLEILHWDTKYSQDFAAHHGAAAAAPFNG